MNDVVNGFIKRQITLQTPKTCANTHHILSSAQTFHKRRIVEWLMNDPTIPPQFEQTSYFLRFQTFPNGNYIRYICMRADGHHVNPGDGKQPKTFGLNYFNFTIFNFLALYIKCILQSEQYGHSYYTFQFKYVFRLKGNVSHDGGTKLTNSLRK